MKSLITSKDLLGLFSTVAIPVIVLAGITQTRFSVETQRKELTKGFELKQDKVLESKNGSQRSVQNPSVSNAFNHPVNDIQLVQTCNMKFSSCPIP